MRNLGLVPQPRYVSCVLQILQECTHCNLDLEGTPRQAVGPPVYLLCQIALGLLGHCLVVASYPLY
jgi:hypothetical protein